MQLLIHKVPTSKVVTKVQLELWGHKSYWRLTALEGLLDKRKIMLRMLKMSDIAIFCSNPLLGFPSPFLSSPSIEISIWISSVAPPNNVSIPIYCLHLNPTTLVDTRRDAILVNVTDSSNYMNSRRQIWIIAINILNGRQIFAFPRARAPNINPHPPKIDLRFNFCPRVGQTPPKLPPIGSDFCTKLLCPDHSRWLFFA